MIVFDLKCGKGHVFEAWFRDNATFETQCNGRKVECPVCGGTKIEKAPMAPNIAVSDSARGGMLDKGTEDTVNAAKFISTCRAIREEVEKNSDYVGPRFAEEARRIHYGETDKRSIYGEASDRDAQEYMRKVCQLPLSLGFPALTAELLQTQTLR